MVRVVKALVENGPGVSGHREHLSKKGRKKAKWVRFGARKKIDVKLRKFLRKELKEIRDYVEH